MVVEESVIREVHPAVLAVTGPQHYEQVVRAVHEAAPPNLKHDPYTDLVPPQGIKLTPRHYAYLKISEGCNHRCRFCIIPRSEEHTSELQSLMRISYAVFCLKKKTLHIYHVNHNCNIHLTVLILVLNPQY